MKWVLFALAPLPYFESTDLTPFWGGASGHLPARIETMRLQNQNGQTVNEKRLDGTLSIVSFFFAECGSVCPRLMHSIQRFQKQALLRGWGDKLRVYSISISPDHDTPERLRDYARSQKFKLSNWSLLTGDASEIQRVSQVFKSKSVNAHSENLFLLDTARQLRGIYMSSDPKQLELLLSDISKLLES